MDAGNTRAVDIYIENLLEDLVIPMPFVSSTLGYYIFKYLFPKLLLMDRNHL